MIFDIRDESNPCSLCARMRRGCLHDTAKAAGCNKIALGHHYDDAVETFVMNLFNEGRIGCFSPVTYLSRKDLTMIRPMVFAPENDIRKAVKHEGLAGGQEQLPRGWGHHPPVDQGLAPGHGKGTQRPQTAAVWRHETGPCQ